MKGKMIKNELYFENLFDSHTKKDEEKNEKDEQIMNKYCILIYL